MHTERTGWRYRTPRRAVRPVGEDLDSVQLIEGPFDRDAQPERQIVYIDTTIFRWQGFLTQYPEMGSAARHLDGGLYSVFLEFQLQRG